MYRTTLAAVAVAVLLGGCAYYPDDYYGPRGYPPPPPPPPGYPPPPMNYPPPPPDYPPPDHPWAMSRHGQEIDYEFRDEVLFAYNSAELSSHAADSIAQVAQDARRHRNASIEVDGYTDTVGSDEYNMGLSQARAQSVADALAQDGVDEGRLSVRGFGKTHLAVQTGDNVLEQRNRRVVVRILPPER